jgi:hypothetical protein
MARQSSSERIQSAGAEDTTSLRARELDRTIRWGLWALPVWTVLLFLATLTHQPDTRTDFAGFARYVTTTEFQISHIVASIIGAGIGVLGLLALFTFLALRVRSRLAAAGLALAVVGEVMITAVFGTAAFGQSAVGRLYLSGHTEDAVAIYNDMYGAPLSATAAAGVLLLVIGVVALGIAVARSGVLPRWAGIGMAVGIVVFGLIGVILADFVQSVGAALLFASAAWLAYSANRAPAL